MVVKLYISGISGNKEVKKKQQRVQMILDSKSVSYEAIDITEPGREKEKEFMQQNGKVREALGKHPLPPQIFNESDYCGDYEDFDMANEVDELEAFLHIPIPSKLGASTDAKINGTREETTDIGARNGTKTTEVNGDVELTSIIPENEETSPTEDASGDPSEIKTTAADNDNNIGSTDEIENVASKSELQDPEVAIEDKNEEGSPLAEAEGGTEQDANIPDLDNEDGVVDGNSQIAEIKIVDSGLREDHIKKPDIGASVGILEVESRVVSRDVEISQNIDRALIENSDIEETSVNKDDHIKEDTLSLENYQTSAKETELNQQELTLIGNITAVNREYDSVITDDSHVLTKESLSGLQTKSSDITSVDKFNKSINLEGSKIREDISSTITAESENQTVDSKIEQQGQFVQNNSENRENQPLSSSIEHKSLDGKKILEVISSTETVESQNQPVLNSNIEQPTQLDQNIHSHFKTDSSFTNDGTPLKVKDCASENSKELLATQYNEKASSTLIADQATDQSAISVHLAKIGVEAEASSTNCYSESVDKFEIDKLNECKKGLIGEKMATNANVKDITRELSSHDCVEVTYDDSQISKREHSEMVLVESAEQQTELEQITNENEGRNVLSSLKIGSSESEENRRVEEADGPLKHEGISTRQLVRPSSNLFNIDKIAYSPQLEHKVSNFSVHDEGKGVRLRNWDRRPSEVELVKHVRGLLIERDLKIASKKKGANSNPHHEFLDQIFNLINDVSGADEVVSWPVVKPIVEPPPPAKPVEPPISPQNEFIQEVLRALNGPVIVKKKEVPKPPAIEESGFLKQVWSLLDAENLAEASEGHSFPLVRRRIGNVEDNTFVHKVRVLLDTTEAEIKQLEVANPPSERDHSTFLSEVLGLLKDETEQPKVSSLPEVSVVDIPETVNSSEQISNVDVLNDEEDNKLIGSSQSLQETEIAPTLENVHIGYVKILTESGLGSDSIELKADIIKGDQVIIKPTIPDQVVVADAQFQIAKMIVISPVGSEKELASIVICP